MLPSYDLAETISLVLLSTSLLSPILSRCRLLAVVLAERLGEQDAGEVAHDVLPRA